MNQSYSQNNARLEKLINDAELSGELVDAQLCNDIAFDLYQLRKKAGLTQKELAIRLDVKQSNVSRWETPGYQGYKVKVLSKIVRTLGGSIQLSINTTKTTTTRFNFEGLIKITNPAILIGYPKENPVDYRWQTNSINNAEVLAPEALYVR